MVAKNIYDDDCKQMLAAYCVQYARFLTADELVEEKGILIKTRRGGERYNPFIGMSNAAYDRMVRLASELGLTPVSRKRVVKVRGPAMGAAANKFLNQA